MNWQLTLRTLSVDPRLDELVAKQEQLQEKIERAQDAEAAASERTPDSIKPSLSLSRRMSVTSKFTHAALEFVNNTGFMQPGTREKLLAE
jgi:hypothetical protein